MLSVLSASPSSDHRNIYFFNVYLSSPREARAPEVRFSEARAFNELRR